VRPLFILLSTAALSLGPILSWAGDFSPFTGQVTEDDVNVRCDSTVGSPVITAVKKNAQLEIVKENYDWYKIRLPKQAPAYIRKDLVECVSSFKNEEPLGGKDFPGSAPAGACLNARVSKGRVNIRLQPNEDSPILGKEDQGAPLAISLETKDWYKIVPPANTFGWIHKKFIEPVKISPQQIQPPPEEKKPKARKERKKN
jgi:uncharacterized protein YgiM (DUF1202 family)